ncbi:hydrolase [Candidatus Kapabacteria bacterium]|nr:hydrolase [Candidatus Kapabacteria bacterium]
MRFEANDTCLVVIDVQEKLFPHIYENQDLEKNIATLIAGFKTMDLPVIVTEQYTKGLGITIDSIKNTLNDSYKPLEKMTFSCCGDDSFMSQIRMINKKNIILCGIETHVCVLQTAIDLKEKGFNVCIINDCVSSRKLSDKLTAIERMKQENIYISSKESILFELLKKSGTDVFKKISKLVK